jgi:hypothetical protein
MFFEELPTADSSPTLLRITVQTFLRHAIGVGDL